jgi:hypothetical protein
MTAITSYYRPGEVRQKLLLQILQQELAGANRAETPPELMVQLDPERRMDFSTHLFGIQKSIRGEEQS